ncbi:MAG: S8 family serine peptidase [Bacteroidota bacterium]|nr:S8 family serine peptidase [Bacteroidota bacterium]
MKYFAIIILISFSVEIYSISPEKKENTLIAHYAKSVNLIDFNELSFRSLKCSFLNADKTLIKCTYNTNEYSMNQVVEQLKLIGELLTTQNDDRVFLRNSVPNDSFLANQWHLNAIKAIQSWDLSKGGVNKNGDTIVVAVIDDGLHVNHPDFQGNIWVNKGEISGNLIDDDSNGYVDDVYGWNFMGQDNDISDSFNYKANHGTPVAGIIGAKGNNKTGISGIMWHVKLMIVNVADTAGYNISIYQSDVIQAYSYVLQQRKLYNQTNGLKGAFVVATNSSWGLDKKFPHQAPLWCAMYDSLGKQGVLNVVAVTNSPENVDVYGDLPTLCESKALITVGSTTVNNQYFNCGFSTTNVDLSAPGANIYSSRAYNNQNISNNMLYGYGHNGTSFAAPMVTGAIGLLNSYTCDKFDDLMKDDPMRATLLLKRFVLEGVDNLPSLEGKNLTSGMLNVFKSMKLLSLFCFDELSIENKLRETKRLYPNPGNGLISIGEGNSEIQDVVKVVYMDGKMVDFNYINNQIDITYKKPGVYYVYIKSFNESYVVKYVLLND